MARTADYNDPEYDRKLAEYKALKARAKGNSGQQEQPRQNNSGSSSSNTQRRY